jgi:hypothetical protein
MPTPINLDSNFLKEENVKVAATTKMILDST